MAAPAPAPAAELAPVADDSYDYFHDVMGMAIARLQREFETALAKRDAEIKALHERFEIEIGLSRKLARVQREITAAKQRQPDFESELNSLREENAKQQKLISRLRGQVSQLEFQQKKLDAEQIKDRNQVSMTEVRVTTFGQRTENIVRELNENGFVVDEAPLLSRLSVVK
jgi:predicted  nucleic acid-binding Zn-ribbon protein